MNPPRNYIATRWQTLKNEMNKANMIKYVISLSLILSLFSCSYKNNFTLYKQKPTQTKSESLRIDGVFINTSKERPDSLYFYMDGTIGLVSFVYGGGNSLPIGHYIIKKDSLLGQYFGRDTGGWIIRTTLTP